MPRAKRKPKKTGFRERIIRLLGGVPTPKPRANKKVSVKPYVRSSPAKPEIAEVEP